MRTAVALLLAAWTIAGQTSASPPAFEAASVKLHEGPMMKTGITTSGLRLDGLTTLRGLVMYAYDVRNIQVSLEGAPYAAVGDSFYDVQAKAEGDKPPTREQFRQMLQNLLADRFHLKIHHDTREMPVYALVVGRNGPRFKESAADAEGPFQVHVTGRNYQLVMPKGAMSDLTAMLENASATDRPVLDQTGLTGSYAIQLTFTPDIRSTRENPDPADIGILQAVEQQLGLKLEPRKSLMPVVVVDHAEKPSAN